MALSKIPSAGFQDNVKFRNIIINGDMSIAQRGTSTASITSNTYALDRFLLSFSGSQGTWTVAQSSTVPSGQGFATSTKIDCTTADASPAAGDRIFYAQRIEGQNLQYLKKGTSSAESTTLSFWVRSNKTGTYIANLFDNDNSRHISKSYTISSADTWEKKTITFAGDTSGTFGNDNARSLDLRLYLGAGSNFTSGTLATSWESATNANAAVGQVNLADSTSNEWYITGVQLEAGTTASDFEFLPYDVNLDRCYRYYQNLPYAFDTPICQASAWSATTAYGVMHLFSTMRTRPSLDQVTGTSYYRYYNTGDSGDFFDGFTIQSEGNGNVIRIHNTDSISVTAGDSGWFVMVDSSSYLAFDSEL